MDGEPLIFLLDITTDEEINGEDETTTDLAEDNADVLWSIARLEVIEMDGELLIFRLDIANDGEINGDDETTTDLAEDNTGVL